MFHQRQFLVVAFVALLLLPWVQKFSGVIAVNPVNERREKAQLPEGGFINGPRKDKEYAAKIEAYFSDHFPLRDALLRIHGQWEYTFFGAAREVVVGEKGWLSDKKLLTEHLPALQKIDADQLRLGILKLKQLQAALNARGIMFLVVVVPLKPSIYSEQFPGYRAHITDITGQTGLDVFQSALSKNSIPYVDILAEFKRRKDIAPLYYKTDMHWNSVGASVGAELIVNQLSEHFLGRAIWSPNTQKSEEPFIGEELKSIPLFFAGPEITPVWSDKTVDLNSKSFGNVVMTFTSADKRAALPPTLMFGNSFMLQYPTVGYHAYFTESSRVLDYENFKTALDYIKPHHKAVILHLYETQLLYHIMPKGKAGAWSGFDAYWDKRLDAVPLPSSFTYVAPDGIGQVEGGELQK